MDQKKTKAFGAKIAFLICGHLRHKNIIDFLRKNSNYQIDVFVFAWDDYGIKGTETKIDKHKCETTEIANDIRTIPNVKKYRIECNKQYCEDPSNHDERIHYFNYSSPEIFIKSQLYSIAKCYEMMEKYCEENGAIYDVVFKLRFDCELTLFELSCETVSDIRENDIVFVTNKSCHPHLDTGDCGCFACNMMYYRHGLKMVHVFEHTNVICDLMAYGSMKAMKEYCSIYEKYDLVAKSHEDLNRRMLKEKNIKSVKKKNVDRIARRLDALYYLTCTYPERLIQKTMNDYMLITSREVKIKMRRHINPSDP